MKQPWKKFNIKGFQEASLLEWEGKLASILFLGGCNFRCPFCHAKHLVLESEAMETIPFERIAAYLNTKKGWLDGVVITGGEPTIHEWLFDLIDELRSLSFSIMLETNGAYPDKIKALLDTKKLNYISMDIKAPFDAGREKYKKATGVDANIDNIKKSIEVIMSSGVDYEFRTTVVPGIIGASDVVDIARAIAGAKKMCLQQFRAQDTLDAEYLKVKPYSKEILKEMAKQAEEFVDTIVIKNT